jgi:hypothetical protein
MSSCGSYSHSFSFGPCGPSPSAPAQCQESYTSHEANRDSLICSYNQTHHHGTPPPPVSVSVLTLAMQEAASMGAGVQGTVGCNVDPTAAQLAGWQALTPTLPDSATPYDLGSVNNTSAVLGAGAGDSLAVDFGDGNTLVVGDGAGDHLTVMGDGNTLVAGGGDGDFLWVSGGGDNNVLWAGNGNTDGIQLDFGDNNSLHLGDGVNDKVTIYAGDSNCVTIGNGAGGGFQIDAGMSNDVSLGNGDGDQIYVGTGDNNKFAVGDGAVDSIYVGSGDHNTLIAGNGHTDLVSMGTGDYNLLHAGDGMSDTVHIATGDFNVLIAGNGAQDQVIVESGNNNVLAVGDGDGSVLQLGRGNYTTDGSGSSNSGGGDDNILLQGNGAHDVILLGGANFDTMTGGHLGTQVNSGNVIVMGNGADDQAWGSTGDNNSYLTGSGNDLVHTGGGGDFVYVDNHTETSDPSDPYHLTTTDSLAQNLYADGGSDTFAIQGAIINTSHQCGSYSFGNCYTNAVSFHCGSESYGGDGSGNVTPLGTTVMTGGGGVEKYWVDGAFGNAVVTDFNSANGDRVMVGGVWDGTNSTLSSLGTVHTEYIHSAYDTANTGNVDLLITFGSGATQGSITLVDFLPQDTGGAGGAEQFNNVTFTNAAAAESTLAHIFDFSQTDNQAVTDHVASLAASNLILH